MFDWDGSSTGLIAFVTTTFLGTMIYSSILGGDILRISYSPNRTEELVDLINDCQPLHQPYHAPICTRILCGISGNIQTIVPTLVRELFQFFEITHEYQRELIRLQDGGTLALDWVKRRHKAHLCGESYLPIILLIPGLCGHSRSLYITYMIKALSKVLDGDVVVFIQRGCGGVALSTPETFTAARTSDLKSVLRVIRARFPSRPLYAAAYSLGAGLLLKYLSEEGMNESHIRAAAAVCPPWDFHAPVPFHDFWINFVALTSLRGYVTNNMKYLRRFMSGAVDEIQVREVVGKSSKDETGQVCTTNLLRSGLLDVDKMLTARTVREFDHAAIVSRKDVHGFATVDEYYTAATTRDKTSRIFVPTLAITSENDPLCPIEGCPTSSSELGPGLALLRTCGGGHLTYPVAGAAIGQFDNQLLFWISQFFVHVFGITSLCWVDDVVVDWLRACIAKNRKDDSSLRIRRSITPYPWGYLCDGYEEPDRRDDRYDEMVMQTYDIASLESLSKGETRTMTHNGRRSDIASSLLQSYLYTDYIVTHKGRRFVLNIDTANEDIVPLLLGNHTDDSDSSNSGAVDRFVCITGALITAYNPYSQVASSADNEAAQQRLRDDIITGLGLRIIEAIGVEKLTAAVPEEGSATYRPGLYPAVATPEGDIHDEYKMIINDHKRTNGEEGSGAKKVSGVHTATATTAAESGLSHVPWSEPMLFVPGCGFNTACMLGQKYAQNAIVWLGPEPSVPFVPISYIKNDRSKCSTIVPKLVLLR